MTPYEQLCRELLAERYGPVVHEHGPVDGPTRQAMRHDRQQWLDQLAAELVDAINTEQMRVVA